MTNFLAFEDTDMDGEQKAFCPYCMVSTDFSTINITATKELDGMEYTYTVKQAICSRCGGYAYYEPYRLQAEDALNDAVRAAKDIVSLEKIRDLPRRYDIGKRPLSRLLGWGELTYSRFMDGSVPTKEYSDTIKELYANPLAFYQLLNDRRDSISALTYKKSRRAVEGILNQGLPDAAKLFDIADYFFYLADGDITASAVQKLIFYSQGFDLALYDKPLIVQLPRAAAGGPVYGQLWYEYRFTNETEPLSPNATRRADTFKFDDSERELLRCVFSSFGRYSGYALGALSRTEPAWIRARQRPSSEEDAGLQGADDISASELIDLEQIRKTFIRRCRAYDITRPCDIAKYADDVLQSIPMDPAR
ncbi:MAG: DUF4065 domain-containing protein [Eggerthellaceae bacterium]|nr:DUF4065 domain-containing protein [Eggerthellaceae bacterium]